MHGRGGAHVAKGAYMVKGGRAWYARPVIVRAVRILLECILVASNFILNKEQEFTIYLKVGTIWRVNHPGGKDLTPH